MNYNKNIQKKFKKSKDVNYQPCEIVDSELEKLAYEGNANKKKLYIIKFGYVKFDVLPIPYYKLIDHMGNTYFRETNNVIYKYKDT